MVHCDIWGGYRTPSLCHANYFLTLVDDYSRTLWVYLIKQKSDASTNLVYFCNMVERQFGKKIKHLRCDNGGEFTSSQMKDFYGSQGIALETSCRYTPQQNGVVERKHRHLLEVARAIRFEANLPIKFWGECILTATYIINCVPSKILKNKTPYEVLLGKPPSYDHMRTFGCLAYYWNNTKGDKFEPRGKRGESVPFGNNNLSNQSQAHKVNEDEEWVRGGDIPPVMDGNQTHVHEAAQNHTLGPQDEEAMQQADNDEAPEPTNDPTHDQLENNEETDETSEPVTHQRGTRVRTQPQHLKDYAVKLSPSVDHANPSHNQANHTVHPLAHYISYENFSTNHKAFMSAIDSHDEPKSFKQASQDKRWQEDMQNEIKALEQNDTWTLEELPPGKKAIDSKWIYKVKHKPNGEVERYKARLIAKGYTQLEGVDYHDTFAPVAKLVTMRALLVLAVKRSWYTHQLDVNNAFLHGDLEEEVYMKVPQGFARENESRVCRLRKSIYGLKQASRNRYHKFTSSLMNLGYKQSVADPSLFIYKRGKVHVAALIYVDDVIIVGNDLDQIQDTKKELHQQFTIKDLGSLKYFLGIEVVQIKDGMVLSQRKYTLDILRDMGLEDPKQPHLEAAIRVVRYLKSTLGQGILLPKEGGTQLITYCDSDWMGCPFTRRSRTGYVLMFGGAPVSWKSKKQSVVSRSSAEAEYRAMAATVSEALWFRWLLTELDATQDSPTIMFCDNEAARHIANNLVFHERTKHVEMDCHFVRERVESKEILPTYIKSQSQLADLLTKPLGGPHLHNLLSKLNISNLHVST
ncbi:hypothetical protein E3N88_01998 [Mikania micrantha]|uniref:Integrase catalytic domain-containing protein n=1 Tax=Mikania micrantha TaxID=192012 RepID=A0A5N6Q2S9_9ASTR|nr:hypothetical protein E3N88_01998 [Mikania micrantha]